MLLFDNIRTNMNVLLEIWTKVQDKEIKGKISTGK